MFGRHDPKLADRGVAGSGDHVADALCNIFGRQSLDACVERLNDPSLDRTAVVRAEFGVHSAGLDDAHANVSLGDFLP